MTYQEAEEYIEKIGVYGSVPGLDAIRELCRRLGNPQNRLKFIHVAGTNGKGSVTAFLSSILKTAGFRTGRYLSPVLFEYRERIQVNGHMISKADFCRHLEQVKAAAAAMAEEGLPHPTPFEVDTALAFCCFVQKECEIVVMETGLGGTLDATNIIENTLAAVITSISMDHVGILGETISSIAEHKAGIIKKGCRVISAPQREEAVRVIEDRCRLLGCPLVWSGRKEIGRIDYGRYRKKGVPEITKPQFTYDGYREVEIGLRGRYQIENAILALEVIEALAENYPVSERKLRKGFGETVWPGRFQVFAGKPLLVVDGAHNKDGGEKLADSLKFYFTNERIIYIMGILRDKDYHGIIKATCKYAQQIITVTTPGPRGMSGYELAQEVLQHHSGVTCADSPEEAVELARLLAGRDGVMVAFGSLSYLGSLIKIIEKSTDRRGAAQSSWQGGRYGRSEKD